MTSATNIALALAAALALTVTACGKDKPDDVQPNNPPSNSSELERPDDLPRPSTGLPAELRPPR